MATPLTDNFNSYNNGNLMGQGLWLGDTQWQVQDSVVYEGAKAISRTDGTDYTLNRADVSGITAGTQVFYIRRTANDNGSLWVELREAGVATHMIVKFDSDGIIYYRDSVGSLVALQAYIADQWYSVKIEFTSTQQRIWIAGVDITGWVDRTQGEVTLITLRGEETGGNTSYLDYFTDATRTFYTLTAETGVFALTGIAVGLIWGRTIICNVGTFVLTGIEARIAKINLFKISKSSGDLTKVSKNIESLTKISKSSGSLTNIDKS